MAGIPQVITEDRASGAQFIGGSLKFDSYSGQYLKRTPTANGNTKLWTWSGWLRQTPGGSEQDMFSAGQEVTNDGYYTRFRLQSDSLNLRQWNASLSLDASLVSSMKLRDPSAFFHCVMIYDVDNSTNTDKVRWYINGQRVTSFSATDYPASESWVNNRSKTHTIGGHYDGGGSADSFWNGHMSQVYFIDGQALGPENFGYTDPLTGIWRPKKYEGDYNIAPASGLNGIIWSNYITGTVDGTYPLSNCFGGTIGSGYTNGTRHTNPGTLTLSIASLNLNVTNVKLHTYIYNTPSTFTVNGTTVPRGSDPNGDVTYTVAVNGQLNTIAWSYDSGSGPYCYMKGIEVDLGDGAGYRLLTDGAGGPTGLNSFYLPMDGNSPIGEDKSGIVTPNNGSIWSASFSSSSGFRSSEPKTNAFDGNTSSVCSAVGSGTITFVSPVKFASNSTIKVFLNGGNHTVTVNGGSNQTISAGSFQTVTYSNSGNSTFVMTFHRGGGADTGVRAIEIDGVLLVDGQIGNNWTPMNFGGSVELPKATGAIPILNTNEAGTVAKGGVRTDSKTYTVTAAGGKYYLDGALTPTLNAYRGGSYTFDYTGAASHPFYLSSLPDGRHDSSSYSVRLDGTGDYLSIPANADFELTGEFTIEYFLYLSSSNNETPVASWGNGTYKTIFTGGGDTWKLEYPSTTLTLGGTASANVGNWKHYALSRDSNNVVRWFIDGKLISTNTVSSTIGANETFTPGFKSNSTNYLHGYISNLRLVKGQALYTSSFTPPSSTLTTTSQGATASNVKLLCCRAEQATTATVSPGTITAAGDAQTTQVHQPFLYNANGVDGVNTGTSNTTKITIPHTAADTLYYYCHNHSGMGSSINVTTDIFKADPYAWKNFLALPLLSNDNDISDSVNYTSNAKTPTNSSVTASTAQSNFYSGSHHWNASGDQITYAQQGNELVLGTGDFTVECWLYDDNSHDGTNNRCYIWDNRIGGSVVGGPLLLAFIDGHQEWNVYVGSDLLIFDVRPSYTTERDNWHHFAVTRESGTVKLWLDGIEKATASGNTENLTTNGIGVGCADSSGYSWAGFIQDFRIYKGVAKYSENFVVGSTAPDFLPDTPSGIVGKTNLTKITDGAVSFDGSGDYLSIPNSSDFSFGSGDFCVEGFVYYTETSGNGTIAGLWNSGSNRRSWLLQIESDVRRLRGFYSLNGSSTVQVNGTTGIMQQNSWHHVALTRNGNDIRLFLNGIQIGSATESGSFYDNSDDGIGVGSAQGGSASDPITGFLSNVRIVKGSAVYTSNFTPPTEPLTAVTNTVLLCCQSQTSASAAEVEPSNYINTRIPSGFSWWDAGAAAGWNGAGSNTSGSNSDYVSVALPTSGKIYWETVVTNPSQYSVIGVTDDGGDAPGNNGYQDNISGYYFNGNPPIHLAKRSGASSTSSQVTHGSSTGTTWSSGDILMWAVDCGSSRMWIGRNGTWYASGNPAGGTNYAFHNMNVHTGGTYFKLAYHSSSSTSAKYEIKTEANSAQFAARGNASANNFNPFTDDINAIRGQETGYPTMNPLAKNSAITLADGNLRIKSTGNHGDKKIVQSTAQIPNGGKWYVEWHIGGSGCTLGFGINGSVDFTGADTQLGTNTYSWGYEPNGNLFHNGNQGGSYGGSSAGDVIGMTIDTSGSTVTAQWYKNGTLIRNSSGTAAEFTGIELGDYIVMMSQHSPNYDTVVNFGQKPFKFPPPDGFQPLNASNVRPETVIVNPDQYVGVSLWTGNGLQKEIGGIKPSENATVVGGTISDPGNAFNGSGANWANLTATNTSTAAHVDFAVNLTGITRIEAAFDSPSSSGDTRGRYNGANGGNTRTGTGSGYSDIYNGSAITVTSVGYGINQNGTTGTSNEILSRFRITDSQGTRFILDGGGEPLSFKPDFVWIKSRSFANNHHLFDSVRGPNKILRSSTAEQETTVNVMTSFNNDGFTVAEAGGNNATNDDGSTFVGWTWKAGGSKGTFNIDDVGYANASDVNMNAASLNSSIYDRSKVWSSLVTTSSLHSSYNSYHANSKFGCFDGKKNTSMYSAGGPLTITFDASAFPASGGPYFVEVETNQRGIKVNGQPSSGYTTDIAPNQATYWANNGSVSSLQSVEINQASGAYGGMCSRIRVNGKVLADSINTSVTWSNAISALSNSSLTNPPNAFDGDEGSYCDSTAGFTIDLSGHTFGTGAHTIEVKSGGATSFTVNGTTSLSGSGSGAIVWSGTHTGELTSLVSSATGASIYYIKVDGEYLLDPGQDYVTNVPSIAPTGCSVNTKSKFGIYRYTGSGSGSGTLSHGLEGTPGLVIYKKRNSSSSWQVYHQSLGGTVYNTLDEDVGDYTSDSTRFGGTNPTSSIITLGTHGNGADDTIMYAWCDVPGLQKFGKWTGINNSDGTFVELGFRPALVIAKESSATGAGAQWFMLDSSRNTYNPLNNILDANRDAAERQGVIYDFLSNGFKIRTTFNSGGTFIYMAWAEAPTLNLYGAQANAR